MNPEVKTKWVEALRSNKYKQTQGQLYDPDSDGYCCLGVLCRVNGTSEFFDNGLYYGKEPIKAYLPKFMDEFAGLTYDQEITLSMLNDRERKSFAEIADWIEENL